ncbi:MAG: hypothetical protein WD513_02210 [Balneolaceae bacterium]
MKYVLSFPIYIIIFVLTLAKPLSAQLSLKGFAQNYNALQTVSDNNLIAGRNRLNIELNYSYRFGIIQSEIELRHLYRENQRFNFRLRQLFSDLYLSNTDIRFGYQRIIWGRADGSFVSDILSPFDLREFTLTDPVESRRGILALNVIRYFGANSLQLVLHPTQQLNVIPKPDSRWFPAQSSLAEVFNLNVDNEDWDKPFEDLNIAVNFRLRSLNRFDLEFFLMHWRYPTPAFGYEIENKNFTGPSDLNLTPTYSSSFMAGSGGYYQINDRTGILSEFLFISDRLFTNLPYPKALLDDALTDNLLALQLFQEFENRDDNYIIASPWLHGLIGFSTELFGFNISSQAHIEWIVSDREQIISDRFYSYITLLASRSFFRDRLQIISLNRYNVSGNDYWLQLEGSYDLIDNLEFTVGTNLFGGESPDFFYGHLSFHQFRQNSFIFSKISIYF